MINTFKNNCFGHSSSSHIVYNYGYFIEECKTIV